jgi:hypothetical protein
METNDGTAMMLRIIIIFAGSAAQRGMAMASSFHEVS